MNLETRRLLQEVANVRRLYENRTVSHLAADFGHPDEVENDYTESRSKVTKPKKTRKQARFSPERTTSQSSSQLSSLSVSKAIVASKAPNSDVNVFRSESEESGKMIPPKRRIVTHIEGAGERLSQKGLYFVVFIMVD
jgi:hypothetical protein